MLENMWIPIENDIPVDDRHVLVSFANATEPDIGRYEEDEDGGGTFFIGDCDDSYLSIGMIPNAWMPLPECMED